MDRPASKSSRSHAAQVRKLAEELAASILLSRGFVYSVGASSEIDEISGDCGEWLFHERNVLAISVELPPANYKDDPLAAFMLDNSEISPIFEENWLGFLGLLGNASILADQAT